MSNQWEQWKKEHGVEATASTPLVQPEQNRTQPTAYTNQPAGDKTGGTSQWENWKREHNVEAELESDRHKTETAGLRLIGQDMANRVTDLFLDTAGAFSGLGRSKYSVALDQLQNQAKRYERDLDLYKKMAYSAGETDDSALYAHALEGMTSRENQYGKALDNYAEQQNKADEAWKAANPAYERVMRYGEGLTQEQIEGQLRIIDRELEAARRANAQANQIIDDRRAGGPETGFASQSELFPDAQDPTVQAVRANASKAGRNVKHLEEEKAIYQAALRRRKESDDAARIGAMISAVKANPDYNNKVQAGRQRFKEDEGIDIQQKAAEYTQDPESPYYGKSAEEIQGIGGVRSSRYKDLFGADSDFLTAEQKDLYYALYATNPDDASEYAAWAKQQGLEKHLEELRKDAGEHWYSRMLNWVAAAGQGLASGLDPFGQTGQRWSQEAEARLQGVAEGLTQEGFFGSGIGAGEIDIPIIGKKSLGDLAQLSNSMLQSGALVLAAKLTGSLGGSERLVKAVETMGTVLMGSSAAASDYRERLRAGWSEQEAMQHAFASGINEALFEYVSLDKLVNQDVARGFFKNLFIQGGVEMSEELCTTLANKVSDYAIASANGRDSAAVERAKELMSQGLSFDEAYEQARREWVVELINDGLGGFISGGMMSMGSSAVSKVHEAYTLSKTEKAGRAAAETMSKEMVAQEVRELDERIALAKNNKNDAMAKMLERYKKGLQEGTKQYATDEGDGTGGEGSTSVTAEPVTPSPEEEGLGERQVADDAETDNTDTSTSLRSGQNNSEGTRAVFEQAKREAAQMARDADDGTLQAIVEAEERNLEDVRDEADPAEVAVMEGRIAGLRQEISAREAVNRNGERMLAAVQSAEVPGVDYDDGSQFTVQAKHTPEQAQTIREYNAAVDEKMVSFIQRVDQLQDQSYKAKQIYAISPVNERQRNDLQGITGIDTSGYSNAINGTAIAHIENRHGAEGKADHSMANIEDIARIGYVLDNYDSVELLTDDNGDAIPSTEWTNKDSTRALQVQYTKKVDGTYYVIEAVIDSKRKQNMVVSAYMNQNGSAAQSLNMEQGSPQLTSKTPNGSNTSNDIIAQDRGTVKGTDVPGVDYDDGSRYDNGGRQAARTAEQGGLSNERQAGEGADRGETGRDGTAGQVSLSAGERGGNGRGRAWGVSEETRRQGRSREQQSVIRQRQDASRDNEVTSPAEFGVPCGSEEATCRIYSEAAWDEEAQAAAEYAYENGVKKVTLLLGLMQVESDGETVSVNGAINKDTGELFARADSTKESLSEIIEHEIAHLKANAAKVRAFMEAVKSRYKEAAWQAMYSAYERKYADVTNDYAGMSEIEKELYVWEEICCDAAASVNKFGTKAGAYHDEATQALDSELRSDEIVGPGYRFEGGRYSSRENAAAMDRTNGPGKEGQSNTRFSKNDWSYDENYDSDPTPYSTYWTIQDGILDQDEIEMFYHARMQIDFGRGRGYTKTKDGERIINVNNKLVFYAGNEGGNPVISKVMVFAEEYGQNLEDAKERIERAARRETGYGNEIKAIEKMYGAGYIKLETLESRRTYGRKNGRGKGSYRGGSAQKNRGGGSRFSVENDSEIDWIGSREAEQRLSAADEEDVGSIDLSQYTGKDYAYMEAVKNGDEDQIRWMNDEAARQAGFSHKGFHQTGADFTSFNTDNEVAGQFDDETPTGIFIKPTDEDIGLTSGTKQMPLYFKADNMLEFANREEIRDYWKKNVPGYRELDAQLQARDNELKRQYDELDAEWFRVYEETYGSDDQSKLDDLDRQQDEFLEKWNKELQPIRRQMKNLVTEYMKGSDYDGIHLKYDGKVYGGPKVETYIVFDPKQTKSAELVTRDNQGKVIPISERFRTDRTGTEEWKNRDLRFSAADEEDVRGVDWLDGSELEETRDTDSSTSLRSDQNDNGEAGSSGIKLNRKELSARTELRTALMDIFHVAPGNRTRMTAEINRLADKAIEARRNKGTRAAEISTEDRKALYRLLYDTGLQAAQADEYYQQIRERLKGVHIYVDAQTRADFGDDYNDFRRRCWANNIYLTADTRHTGADVINAELAEDFPGAADANELDPRAMLENILDLAEKGKTEKLTNDEALRRQQSETGEASVDQMKAMRWKADRAVDDFLFSLGTDWEGMFSGGKNGLTQKKAERLEQLSGGKTVTDRAAWINLVGTYGERTLRDAGFTPAAREQTKQETGGKLNTEELLGTLDPSKDGKDYGTSALQKLGVTVEGSVGDFSMVQQMIASDKSAKSVQREIRKAEKRLNANAKEKDFASGIAAGIYTQEDIPGSFDREKILDLADYYAAERATANHLIRDRRAQIKQDLDMRMAELFKDSDQYKSSSMLVLNERTPERNMRRIFGDKLGEEINRTLFYPTQHNEAERLRFINRMHDAVRTFQDSSGKKTGLTVEERALAQMLLEGQSPEELAAGAEIAETVEMANRVQKALQAGKIDQTRVNNAVETYRALYNQMYDAINDFLVAHGYEPIGFRKDYAPHMQTEETQNLLQKAFRHLGVNAGVTELPASIAGLTADYKPSKRWNPHFLERTGNSTAYDIAQGFEEYVEYLSDIFYHMDDTMRVRQAVKYFRETYAPENIKAEIERAKAMEKASTEEKLEILRDAKDEEGNSILSKDSVLSEADVNETFDKYLNQLYNRVDKTTKHSNLTMWLDNYANLLAGKQSYADRGQEHSIGRKAANWANWVVRRFAQSKVAGNLSSVLNQGAQIPMIYSELGTRWTAAAMRDIVSGKLRKAAWWQQSDFLTGKHGIDYLVSTPGEMVMTAMFKPAELMDGMVSTLAVRGKYLEQIKAGKSHEEAMRAADRFGTEIMGSRMKGARPNAYAGKGIMNQMVHIFQVEAVNSWEHLTQDLPRDFREIAQTKGKGKAALALSGVIVKMLLAAFVLNRWDDELYGGTPAPFDLIGLTSNFIASGEGLSTNDWLRTIIDNGMEKLTGDRIFGTDADEIGDEEFNWNQATEDTLYNISNDVPFVRNLSGIMGWGDQSMPMPDFYNKGKNVVEAIKEHGAISPETGKALLQAGTEVIPGGNQINKTVQGIEALLRGGDFSGYGDKEKLKYPLDESTITAIKALLFGKYATSESNSYYASGDSMLSHKQTVLWKNLVSSGIKRQDAYKAIQDFRDIEDEYEDQSSWVIANAKRTFIARLPWTDSQKSQIFSAMVTNSRNDDILAFRKAGLSFRDFVKVYNAYAKFDNTIEGKSSEKAAAFSQWINQQGYTPSEKETIDECFKYWYQVPATAGKYDTFVEAGLADDDAMELNNILADLQPEEGKDQVSNLQKYQAIVNAGLNESDQMLALRSVMSEEEYAKLEIGNDLGVSPTSYITLKTVMPDFDEDKNGGYTQEEVKNAVESMSGLTTKQKATLWQLADKRWKAKNNPFDPEIGQRVYDALHAG